MIEQLFAIRSHNLLPQTESMFISHRMENFEVPDRKNYSFNDYLAESVSRHENTDAFQNNQHTQNSYENHIRRERQNSVENTDSCARKDDDLSGYEDKVVGSNSEKNVSEDEKIDEESVLGERRQSPEPDEETVEADSMPADPSEPESSEWETGTGAELQTEQPTAEMVLTAEQMEISAIMNSEPANEGLAISSDVSTEEPEIQAVLPEVKVAEDPDSIVSESVLTDSTQMVRSEKTQAVDALSEKETNVVNNQRKETGVEDMLETEAKSIAKEIEEIETTIDELDSVLDEVEDQLDLIQNNTAQNPKVQENASETEVLKPAAQVNDKADPIAEIAEDSEAPQDGDYDLAESFDESTEQSLDDPAEDLMVTQPEQDVESSFKGAKEESTSALSSELDASGANQSVSKTDKTNVHITRQTVTESARHEEPVLEKLVERSVVDQVKAQLQLRHAGDIRQAEMTFRLQPENLGEVTTRLMLQNNNMIARMNVENDAVKTALEANIAELRRTLADQGIKIEKIEVTVKSDTESGMSLFHDHRSAQGFNDAARKRNASKRNGYTQSVKSSHSASSGSARQNLRMENGRLDYLV
ncbi:MAG: flagellar hook-length control protein FliK [Candidatus Auribacterota bacterium]